MDAVAKVLGVVLAVAVVAVALRALAGKGAEAAGLRHSLRSRRAWLVVAPATLAVLAFGVPFAYVEWGQDEAPPPLAFEPLDTNDTTSSTRRSTTTTIGIDPSATTIAPFVPPANGAVVPTTGATTTVPTTEPSAIAGTWTVGRGSIAGYRAQEKLVAQDNTAAGRTSEVDGQITIDGTTVTGGDFRVNLASVTSDSPQRDERYRAIMDTARHPRATLVLTAPIDIGAVPPEGEVISREASGSFTIKGVTKSVTFTIQARIVKGRIEILSSIPVKWSDYGISDPGNGVVRVHDHGTIEMLLYLDRA